jgi:hypothetical protein
MISIMIAMQSAILELGCRETDGEVIGIRDPVRRIDLDQSGRPLPPPARYVAEHDGMVVFATGMDCKQH